MARFEVLFNDDRCTTAETLADAQSKGLALAKSGEVYGICGQTGKAKFYLKRGSVAYAISAKAAGLEVWMRGAG